MKIEIIRKNIKNMYLKILPPKGEIQITAPKEMDMETIWGFVAEKESWILARRRKIKAQPLKRTMAYISGEVVYVLGNPLQIELIYRHAKIKIHPQVQEGKEALRLFLSNEKDMDTANASVSKREKIIFEYLRERLVAVLDGLVKKWSAILGVRVSEIRTKNMKTRWGSCNIKDKRIWINLQMAKRPLDLIEYVLVHEMIHLLVPNHNKDFYHLLSQHIPNWKRLDGDLKTLFFDPVYENQEINV